MYDDVFKLRYGYAPIAIGIYPEIEEHFHCEFEMLLIEKGSCVLEIGNNKYYGKSGDLFFVNSLEKHSLTERTKDYFHKCICFDTELIADKNLKYSLKNGELLVPNFFKSDSDDTKILSEYFLKLFEISLNNKITLSLECSIYISAIFLHLIDNSLLIQRFQSKKEKEFCQKTVKFISDNYNKKTSSKDIAKNLHYSQSYFCRAFRKNFGVSFTDYLNMYRVYKAKELLLKKTTTVTEVSESCGFDSPTYFARMFKKYIGMTPTEFQKVNSVH